MNQKQEKEMIEKAIKNFEGLIPTLEGAIGTYLAGKEMGWKVVYLVHDKRTIRKYEEILGIEFKEELPDEGRWAHKSVALEACKKVSNFWKAVKGEIPGIRTQEMNRL